MAQDSKSTVIHGDEDGELYLDIPEELLEQLGWEDGTLLDWAIVGDSIRISKVAEEPV